MSSQLPAARAADGDRDFSGTWVLDETKSDLHALLLPAGASLTVNQQGSTIRCNESGKDGNATVWIYHTDGSETKFQNRNTSMNSLTKWEGAALMTNTIVSGPQSYVVMDRWQLSKDHTVLTIKREIQRGSSEVEAVLVYRNPQRAQEVAAAQKSAPPAAQSAPEAPSEMVIEAGTKIALAMINSVSTKQSSEGDRIYLETVYPVVRAGQIIIPRGSYVIGTVTEVKRPGRVKGRGDLFLRFDSLTLPNGTTRDFRSRLGNADPEAGAVDRKEGKIRGEGNKAGDARTIGETTGVGASVGGIAGSIAHHPGMGVGIGAAAGAAAGLAGVLLSRGPDVVIPKGTTVEMVLDRSLRFQPKDLVVRQ